MPRLPFRLMMFLSSYAPLFALLAYVNRHHRTVWVVLVGVAFVSLLGLLIVMLERRDQPGPSLTILHAKPQDGDVLAYIATYLIPFLSVDLTTKDGVIIFCGFLFVLGVISINSNMLLVNPVLMIAGYHSFAVTDLAENEYSLITPKRELEPGDTLTPAQITRYLRIQIHRDRT